MMRLTLRTMLAYLDGLLEPEDAKDIGKKIEDSKFATDMLNRVRDVMRRLRLTAPPLTERDPLSNANTVAEYLDNVLPGDRVPEFEEMCLKSDVHLAEVASSHQILTLVLGEAAEIDPASRQRMYQLPQVAASADEERRAAAAAAGVIAGDGAAADAASRGRPRPLVPEYLREPSRKRRLLPAAAMLLLAGGLAGLLLMFMGQFERGTPLGNLIERGRSYLMGAAGPELAENEPQSESPPAKAGLVPATEEKAPAAAEAAKPASVPAEAIAGAPAGPEAKVPAEQGKVGPAATEIGPAGNPPVETAKPVEAAKAMATAKPAETVPPREAANPGETAKPDQTKGPLQVATLDAKARMKAETPPGPATERPAVGEHPAAGPGGKAATGPPPAPEAGTAEARVGRVISDAQDILVKDDVASAVWRRVSAEEFLPAGEALVALPTYRPRVVILSVGATLELLGGTRIELTDDGAQGRPGLKLAYGRVVLKPLVQPGIRVHVSAGPRSGTITLSSVESVAAVEAIPVHEPGTDPEAGPQQWSVTLYAARGGLVWDEGRAAAVPLTAPARLVLAAPAAGAPPAEAKDVPKWVAIDTVSPLEQRASVFVAQALQPDRPAGLVLMELIEDRRSEVRLLAARCLGYLGQCGPLVAALNDEKFKREWPAYIDQLRQAVARGPETAAAVRQAMERQFGQESASLYRMLWGYTDKDLQKGEEDARLVKFLDHETLAFRVLAFGTLKDISGSLGSHYYRPELPADKRQPLVQRWMQEQQAGKIRHKGPEDRVRASAEPAPPAAGEQPLGSRPRVPPPPLPAPPPGSDLPPARPAAPESGPPPATPPATPEPEPAPPVP